MRFVFLVLFETVLLLACTRHEEQSSAFTLATGVSLAEVGECRDVQVGTMSSVKKEKNDYVLTVQGFFACEAELDKPFLTLSKDKKATLVLGTRESKLGFSSSCECARSLKVRISGRLEAGDTLYLLYDREVFGHISLP